MLEFPSARSIALAQALDVSRILLPKGTIQETVNLPSDLQFQTRVGNRDVLSVTAHEMRPNLEVDFYAPTVPAGAAFTGYLILVNRGENPYAVKPTDRATINVQWAGRQADTVSIPIPLVTSSVSVVPVPLTAPSQQGVTKITVSGNDAVLGQFGVITPMVVGEERAAEVVLPASVEVAEALESDYHRGDTVNVSLRWLPFNKVNAYYSASVRLVDEHGNKVTNVDRQPVVETFLWRPDEPVPDTFSLQIPKDIEPGSYYVEVLMYQGNSGESALLLNGDNVPRESIRLGRINVE
jgi:hypothetical protein